MSLRARFILGTACGLRALRLRRLVAAYVVVREPGARRDRQALKERAAAPSIFPEARTLPAPPALPRRCRASTDSGALPDTSNSSTERDEVSSPRARASGFPPPAPARSPPERVRPS